MIERIIIENFKSIRKLDLELKPINILIGANGAGKSNFVSFFKLASSTYKNQTENYIEPNIDKLLYFGRKKSKYIDGLIDFENEFAIYFSILPEENSNKGFVKKLALLANKFGNNNAKYAEWESMQLANGGNFVLEMIFENNRYEVLRNYMFSFEIYHFHDTGKDSPMKRINELSDNRFMRENGENLAAFLYYLQEKHPKEFQNIENQIRSVAPFFDRFDLAPYRLNEKQIELVWLEKGSDAYFDAYYLSDGTLRFMALTTLLLQPDLPKTVIIDEPELGLHPFAINKLAAMMKQAAAKGSQVIVSTQSVNLVDNFEPEDVIAVDREDNQSVFRRLNSEDLKDWLEDYTLGDLWNKNVFGARP
ncbi:MAG: AAA family ATPase [Acidobacteriota bacterium]|nr:AAA family ATPase [Acidobacteriota bacterium]